MFFGSHKRPKDASVSRTSTLDVSEALERQSRQWRIWRSAATDVTRAWHECLAAGGTDRKRLYRRYLSALEEEERTAAAIKHTIDLIAKIESAQDSIAPTHTPSVHAASGTPRQGARARNRPGSE